MKRKSESRRRGASARRTASRSSRRGTGRHRLPAHVTGEDDWDVEVPQIRMSRAFAVMLLLHLVAVGGLIAFHMYGKDDQEPGDPAARPPAAAGGGAAKASGAGARAAEVAVAAAPRAELLPESGSGAHVVSTGETPGLVAARYGISVQELLDANPDIEFAPGAALAIPGHQRVISAPVIRREEPEEVDLYSPARGSAPQKGFAMKEDPEPRPVQEVAPVRTASGRGTSATSAAGSKPPPAPARRETASTSGRRETSPAPAATRETARSREAKPARAIPVAEPVPKTAASDTRSKPSARTAGGRTHVVGKGDTLYSIAKKYKLSGDEIARANGITDASKLRPGQVLTIPRS